MNLPFARLSAEFGYPDILRHPAADILRGFREGGTPLILTWYAYALVAFGLVPLAWHWREVLRRTGGASTDLAAVVGTVAGLAQAFGLLRWVFVVPRLADSYLDSGASAATRGAVIVAFEGWHQFAGVAIGEHVGQLATALWVTMMSRALWNHPSFARGQAVLGWIAAAGILAGLPEGLGTVVAGVPSWMGAATPFGFGLFSLWLISLGVTLVRMRSAGATNGSGPGSAGPSA